MQEIETGRMRCRAQRVRERERNRKREEARRHFEEQGIICPANKTFFELNSELSGRGREAEREKIERV